MRNDDKRFWKALVERWSTGATKLERLSEYCKASHPDAEQL